MSGYWARRLSGATPAAERERPTVPQSQAWWQQAAQQTSPALQYQMPGAPAQTTISDGRVVNDDYIRQLQRLPADQLNQEQMETIARFELGKQKYNQMCPQCGSANYVPVGTKLGGVVFPTEKCFDCGLSARGPEPSLGGRGGAGVPTQSVRQTDTGGGAGSMYMQFNGVPATYMPRGG